MDIDTAILHRASLPNLERLATALGVDLGREKRRARRECKAWHWALCALLAKRLGATAQTDSAGVVVEEVEGDTDGDDNDMGAEASE